MTRTVSKGDSPGEYFVTYEKEGERRRVFGRTDLSDKEVLAILDEADKPPEPGPAAQREAISQAIEQMLDQAARARGYRDGPTLASYFASGNKAWAAEAVAFAVWRDKVWETALPMLDDGASMAAILKALPDAAWP